jgi:hypothetical protein
LRQPSRLYCSVERMSLISLSQYWQYRVPLNRVVAETSFRLGFRPVSGLLPLASANFRRAARYNSIGTMASVGYSTQHGPSLARGIEPPGRSGQP